MKKEIISITGNLGGGKSSTADKVAERLGYKRFSAGDFMRNIALDRNITLNELQKIAENDFSIDKSIDAEVKKVGEMNKVVIDSRMAFHFIPESFKVYLELPPEIAKGRIFQNIEENALRKQSENASTTEEIYERILARLESERKRYQEYYGVDHGDKSNFDLVIDTNKNNLEEVVNIILTEYRTWLNS